MNYIAYIDRIEVVIYQNEYVRAHVFRLWHINIYLGGLEWTQFLGISLQVKSSPLSLCIHDWASMFLLSVRCNGLFGMTHKYIGLSFFPRLVTLTAFLSLGSLDTLEHEKLLNSSKWRLIWSLLTNKIFLFM